jgi:hypothetical protein
MLRLVFATAGASEAAPAGRAVNVWTDAHGAVVARGFSTGEEHQLVWSALGTFRFTTPSPVVTVYPEPGIRHELVRDMFARVIQPVVLQAQGAQALHASAVLGPHGVVAFCGVGHSGKSTFAYALSQASGYRQIADDSIVIDVTESSVLVRRLPFRPKLRQPSLRFFRDRRDNDPHAALPEDAMTGPPAVLHAIVLLAQDPAAAATAAAVRLDRAATFPELLRHAHCFDESDRRHNRALIEAYLAIADRVPVYRLAYRPAIAEIDAVVSRLLACVTGPRPAVPAPSDHSRP